jgi:hypothetical protein
MEINPYESPGDLDAPGILYRWLSWFRGIYRREGWCSFCRSSYRDVGPLVEGPNRVYICHPCCLIAKNLIEEESERSGKPLPQPHLPE